VEQDGLGTSPFRGSGRSHRRWPLPRPPDARPARLATLRAAITLRGSPPSRLRRLLLCLAAAAGVAVALHPQLRHCAIRGMMCSLRACRASRRSGFVLGRSRHSTDGATTTTSCGTFQM
jgi:hypothetical protein